MKRTTKKSASKKTAKRKATKKVARKKVTKRRNPERFQIGKWYVAFETYLSNSNELKSTLQFFRVDEFISNDEIVVTQSGYSNGRHYLQGGRVFSVKDLTEIKGPFNNEDQAEETYLKLWKQIIKKPETWTYKGH